MPGLPGSQSLHSQQAGFGPVNLVLPVTAEGLQAMSLRADSSEKQKVYSPTDMFSISTAQPRAPPPCWQPSPGLHIPLSQIRTLYPKIGTAGVRLLQLLSFQFVLGIPTSPR